MIRQILVYMVVFGLLFFLGEYIHTYSIQQQEIDLGFSLQKMYGFHAFFSLQLCIVFLLLSENKKISPQLGFIYLATFVIKIVLFCIVFYDPLFTAETLMTAQRLSLFIPMIIFLAAEAYFIVKILNKNHSQK